MDLPKRKQIRLPEYDYSTPGAYFVSICTTQRRCILSEIAVGAATSRPPEVRLTALGMVVASAVSNISSVYPAISIDNYVIMPNHVHLILRIVTVIGHMKRWASMRAGTALWQKSFHEHVIRNEEDYRQIWEYVENNPARWAEDRYYAFGVN